jgi:hypothetical protein
VHIRVKELIIYEDKSLREYRKYAAIYRTYFTAVKGDKFKRIELAIIYLRGNSLSIWIEKKDKSTA